MNILAFESSCDETAAAVVRDGRTVLSDVIASQADMHAVYGGVVPEIASRKHVEAIVGLADQALARAGLTRADIDAVAVTYAPGLIGALLVGVNFAKAAAYGLGVPLIPVHHVRGHIAANYITHPELEPPFVCLCVSGGNTMLVDVRDYTDMAILGATRDDAAGECFDKVARVLGIGYPGGAPMDALAQGGDDRRYEPVWYDYEIRPVRRQITKVEMDKDGLTVSTGSENFLLTEDGELVGLCNAIAGREVKLIFDPAQVMPEAEALKAAILTNYKSVRRVSISPDCRTAGKSEG